MPKVSSPRTITALLIIAFTIIVIPTLPLAASPVPQQYNQPPTAQPTGRVYLGRCPGQDDQQDSAPSAIATTPFTAENSIVYTNKQYGFRFYVPKSWKGYRIIKDKWSGGVSLAIGSTGGRTDAADEEGPQITIRHPHWTEEHPYQDIPIMIFTHAQYDLADEGSLVVSAAPFGPGEIGRNAKYVFALPPRYTYAIPDGYQEVIDLMFRQPLHPF